MIDATRRRFMAGSALGAAALAAPALWRRAHAQTTKIRIGYLPVIPSDAHIGLAEHHGLWKEEGLEPEYVKFSNGVEQFQALVGGSLDVLSAGAALANFPARGQGKVFLASFLERASTQLWVNPEQGVSSVADLKGRQVATARGTTAELFLSHALADANLKAGDDVEIVNQRIPDAVTAFISGAVPAVALWVPFNVQIQARMPKAVKLTDAGAFFPATAVLDGWATSNAYHADNADALRRLIRVWAKANDVLLADTGKALDLLHQARYPDLSRTEVDVMLDALTAYPTAEWRSKYQDGTVTGWLQQTTDFFAKAGPIENPLPAKDYFDPELFLQATG